MLSITHIFTSVQLFGATESISSSTVSTHLAELLDLCSLYTDDGASQALVDQQSQLTLKIHTVVMLVLRDDAMNDTTNYIGRKKKTTSRCVTLDDLFLKQTSKEV